MNVNYVNTTNVPLVLAVWLANDSYDYDPRNNLVSTTGLLKPIRQSILASRIKEANVELSMLTSSRIGSAIHDSIERAWHNPEAVKKGLKACGYPNRVIDSIVINPDPSTLTEDDLPVYLEQRAEKEFKGFIVSGKFDIVINGMLGDIKNTSVFTYMNQTNAEKYILQGSIYRWLNPEIITDDYMEIYHQFTDWSALDAQTKKDKGYPPTKLMSVKYRLLSLQETERFISNQLDKLSKLSSLPQSELPLCTDEELWMDPPTYKYYSDPSKTTRSTKNFDNPAEANLHLANAGKGIVLEVRGKAKACRYCNAAPICTQYEQLQLEGKI